MRFQRYLSEKYAATHRSRYGDADVFVNPTSKDWREMHLAYGFRFIADMPNKNVYVWTEGGIHADVMDGTNITPFRYSEYVSGEKGADRWFAGLQNPDKSIESDTWDSILWKAQRGESPELVKDIMTMRGHDTKWLARYNINVKAVDQKLRDSRYDV